MNNQANKTTSRLRRRMRIRAKIFGTQERPRFSVFKSNKFISAQLIDDVAGKTLVAASANSTKDGARSVGKEIAKKALAGKIEAVVFDRGGYIYTGKIREVAEGAREGGLKF
jgi:large subunit ribosomal protein L18